MKMDIENLPDKEQVLDCHIVKPWSRVVRMVQDKEQGDPTFEFLLRGRSGFLALNEVVVPKGELKSPWILSIKGL